MGLIREPLEVDFTVDPRELTKAEKNAISEYIRNYKLKEIAKNGVHPAKNNIKDGKRTLVKQ
jgi:hypothetical protein